MSTNLNFALIPREIRLETYSHLSPKDLRALYRVCNFFKNDLTNDFLKERCFAFFPLLTSIPNFCKPFVETLENPWRWMCFSLSCKSADEIKLMPFAEELALASIGKFKSYLEKTVESYQTKLASDQASLKAICGEGVQDPKSKINQAITLAQEAWTKSDEEEVESLERSFSTNLQATRERSNIGNKLEEKNLTDPEMLSEEEFSTALEIVKKHTSNLQIIKHFQLVMKKAKVDQPLAQLKEKASELNNAIQELSSKISTLEIVQDHEFLHKYATTIIFQTLQSLPLMRRWKDHISEITNLSVIVKLSMDSWITQSLEGIENKINSLPQDISSDIWNELRRKHANGDKNWKMSQREHLSTLSQLIPSPSDMSSIGVYSSVSYQADLMVFVDAMDKVQKKFLELAPERPRVQITRNTLHARLSFCSIL